MSAVHQPKSINLPSFYPSRQAALDQIKKVDPNYYAKSRNFINGGVSYLSPWMTHGLTDTWEAAYELSRRFDLSFDDKLIFEFGWREFFKHAHYHLGDGVLEDVRRPEYSGKYAEQLPQDIKEARTGIGAIDAGIQQLYQTGYIHNHVRMWIASYVVHIRKVSWRVGADWMYGHLLDGDVASNHLSWQWVAGTFSHKPYLFNAENVSKYAPQWDCSGTVIDTDYQTLADIAKTKTLFGPEPDAPAYSVREPDLMGFEEYSRQLAEDHYPMHWVRTEADLGETKLGAIDDRVNNILFVHPWMLNRDLYGGDTNTLAVGIVVNDFHNTLPWSAARWKFALAAMKDLVDEVWVVDAASAKWIERFLESKALRAYSAECLNLYYKDWLETVCSEVTPPRTILPRINMFQRSFSKFYRKGCAMTDSLERALAENQPTRGRLTA